MKKLLFVLLVLSLLMLPITAFASPNPVEPEATEEIPLGELIVPEEIEQENAPETQEEFDLGKWLSNFFSPAVVATIMSVVTSLGVVLKLANTVLKLAKQKQTTIEDVAQLVKKTVAETTKEESLKLVNDLIAPITDKVNTITPILTALTKMIALSQENSPESKLAILELVQSLGTVSTKVIEDAKQTIVKQVEEEKEEKVETINTLAAIAQGGEGRY